ncbi:hypothetical protein [Desulfuromonas thiophila]|uniref:hypothetical protein n=1 Tax=Desulfuromonas thiophila TaxID=57664 RepID=UPI0029F5A7AD|nr:hypothetical protein [Desulfuromonas thiophila]
MKTLLYPLMLCAALGLAACKKDQSTTATTPAAPQELNAAQQAATPAPQISGKVLETMNTAGYTYVLVETATDKVWVAAPEFAVKVGDPVIVGEVMAMPNYHSKTLNRDFELVYFASGVAVAGADMPLDEAHAGMAAMAENHGKPQPVRVEMDFTGLTPPEGGLRVGDLYAQQDQLAGTEVVLRAKVVKFSPNIMKTNWLHLQDGSGEEGSNDLTVTSATEAKPGDTVLVRGLLEQNQDFGYGYKYDLIIQNASVTVE